MPVTAVLSILHRLSGVLLFLAFPAAVYFFDLALRGPEQFAQVREFFTGSIGARAAGALMLWALLHHLFAGIRYLLLDARIGIDRSSARRGAWLVFAIEIVCFLVIAKAVL